MKRLILVAFIVAGCASATTGYPAHVKEFTDGGTKNCLVITLDYNDSFYTRLNGVYCKAELQTNP